MSLKIKAEFLQKEQNVYGKSVAVTIDYRMTQMSQYILLEYNINPYVAFLAHKCARPYKVAVTGISDGK